MLTELVKILDRMKKDGGGSGKDPFATAFNRDILSCPLSSFQSCPKILMQNNRPAPQKSVTVSRSQMLATDNSTMTTSCHNTEFYGLPSAASAVECFVAASSLMALTMASASSLLPNMLRWQHESR